MLKHRNASRPAQIRRWSAAAVVVALFAWMAIVWAHFGGTIVRFYSPLPYFDYWNTVTKIDSYRHFDLSVLWQQHNEHRIVFPEIIFAADHLFFRGLEILPITFSALFYFGTWLILSATLCQNKPLPRFARLCAILVAGIVMGWEGGAFVIGAPFLVQFPLMLAATAMSLFLLARVRSSKLPWTYLAGSIACAGVCNYTSANGLFVWPVILLAAGILRMAKVQLAILAASAAALIGLFFIGYRFSRETNFAVLASHPL